MRSLGMKIAASVGLGCVFISVLPAIKQASTSTFSITTAGETKRRKSAPGARKRKRKRVSEDIEVLSDENTLDAGGTGPNRNVSCPKLSDIVSCPNASTQDDVLYCRDCISQPIETTYRVTSSASSSIKPPDHHIYIPILAPPFSGSSVLSNILSSSPYVTNMCKDPYRKGRIPWQCESTPTLIREGVITKKTRWDPLATNWTTAYDTYERLRVWKDMDKPIRLDKGPPNIAKSKQLVEYYEANGMDYRFVVMMRHPCRKDWKHPKFPTLRYASYLREILKFVPEEKRFLINYDDLVTRPGVVFRNLLSWFPLLTSLTIDSHELRPSKMNVEAGQRKLRGASNGGSLLSYIQSNKCVLSLRQNSASHNIMIIPIRAPTTGDATEKVEWIMLELNGELLKPLVEEKRRTATGLPTKSSGVIDEVDIKRRVELGSVKFDSDGAPTLIIGNHELKGTSNKLKEPFAVLRKRKASQIANDDDRNNGANGGTAETNLKKHSGVQLEVVGIVKKKLMFDSYPKSIMR